MKRSRVPVPDHNADELLEALLERQFVRPHRPLGEALADLALRFGFCEPIAVRAVVWLSLDGSTSIGRLRRSELSQLARSIHRFWRQTLHRATDSGAVRNNPSLVVASERATF